MDRGYIKLFRKFFDSTHWKKKRVFSHAEAWIDLLQMARWKDTAQKLVDERGCYTLEQGDIYVSLRFLGVRWKWSKNKVNTFFSNLIEMKSISFKKRDSHRTILHINKLGTYLAWEDSKRDSEGTVKGQSRDSLGTKKKKDKKDKKEEPNNIPDWIPKEAWEGFVEMRKKGKAPLSDRAMKLAITELGKLKEQGNDPEQVLNQSVMNGWKALYKIKNDGRQGQVRGPGGLVL